MAVLVDTSKVRTAGRLSLWAGVLGAVSGIFLAVRTPAVGSGQWSFPQGPAEFGLTQGWFAVQHFGLFAGIWALHRLIGGRGRFGYAAAAGGMVALAVLELVAVLPAEQSIDDPFPLALGVAYGVVSTLIGVGLVAMGVSAIRSGVLEGWSRFLPLSLGIWVFVPMMPAMGMSFIGARLAITGWMILFAGLGWLLIQRGR